MGTGACLLDKESDMPCGLIIEKVNGIPVEKRLASDDESFADVRYMLEMCRQVMHIFLRPALPRIKIVGCRRHTRSVARLLHSPARRYYTVKL